MIINMVGDGGALHSLFAGFLIKPFHLAVQSVPHQFECDIRVAIDARRLALCRQKTKNFIDVGHIEVAAQTKVFGAPVVATQEGMDES